ncbi:MAG TPA: SurA N-terminal domain-containing protein [Acidobacteriota bacterium]|nr:SurA N-terminal domain-containing protein [Acidobacteriota bacterium]
MLDLMRRKQRLKIILWVVIFSLALGMLLFFVPGINMGSVATDNSAATVDGQSIAIRDFALAYNRTVKRYSNGGKNNTDPETLKAMGLPRQVLDEMITSKILQAAAKRLGVDVSANELSHAIETYPYFQNQGRFIGVEEYKNLLASNDLSVEDFETDLRQSLLVNKLRSIITDSVDMSDKELREEFARDNEKAEVSYTILKKQDFKARVKPVEADLRAYFEAHKAAYQIKEKRKAQYLLIPITALLPGIDVTDQEILDEWNKKPHGETVEAAHILIKVSDESKDAEAKAKAEEVLKKLKAGGDFAALAKQYSQDTGSAAQGGYLGPFQRGQMVKEFEDAAFSLKPGETSGLVRSEHGYHIIRVMRHETPTLESSRPQLMIAIRAQKAQELAKQKAEAAAQLLQKNKDLNLAARSLGIAAEIKETPLFTKDDSSFEPFGSPAMRDEIFALKEINSIGKPVDHPLGMAIPKLVEVQMPRPGDFALSREQIEKDYADAKATELMQAEAKKLSDTARAQGSLEKAAKEMGLTVKASQPFNISGTPDAEIGANTPFNRIAFDLQPGGVGGPVSLSDNAAVLQVKSRSPFDEAAFQKGRSELKARLLQSRQEMYFQDYVRIISEELEKAGKIRINPKALDEGTRRNYY